MIIVTRGTPEEYRSEVKEILENLQEKAYRAPFEKSKFFQKEVDWCGFRIEANGIKS